MAEIDKIYMDDLQITEFLKWAIDNSEDCYTKTGEYFLDYPYKMNEGVYVVNLPEKLDWYLWHYCSLPFIQARLKVQYETKPPKNEIDEYVNFFIDSCGGVEKAYSFLDRLNTNDILSVVEDIIKDIRYKQYQET